MTTRRVPRWSELRPLLRFHPIALDPVERRLARAHTIGDLRAQAMRRTPRAVFDYADGAADEETSLRRARKAFASLEFRPRVLRDVSSVDPGTTVLGARSAYPFALAPTGFTRFMQHEGESAVARVAAETGIPYALSTMGTTSVEDLASTVPAATRWFQLYMWRDRARSKDLIDRALAAGYQALILTVDVPVAGARLRDVRNGMTIPPTLSPRTLLDFARYPSWWWNLLTTDPLRFASIDGGSSSLTSIINGMFDPAVTFDDLEWMRAAWPHQLVVKGIQHADDARRAVAAGADAVIVSNHGGRQLDRAPTPLELLPSVVDAVGSDAEVLLDTGILNGADIVAALCLGASACLVGRAYLYGLMAGGERGVRRATTILTGEITRTMQLLGARTIADLHPTMVRLRP